MKMETMIKGNLKLLLLASLFMAPVANAEEAKKPAKPQWEVIDTLTDAKGDVYEFRKLESIHYGIRKIVYRFVPRDSKVGHRSVSEAYLYDDKTGCPTQDKKESVRSYPALLNQEHYKRFYNSDDILDLSFSATYGNCINNELKFHRVMFISKPTGGFEYQGFYTDNKNPEGFPVTIEPMNNAHTGSPEYKKQENDFRKVVEQIEEKKRLKEKNNDN